MLFASLSRTAIEAALQQLVPPFRSCGTLKFERVAADPSVMLEALVSEANDVIGFMTDASRQRTQPALLVQKQGDPSYL